MVGLNLRKKTMFSIGFCIGEAYFSSNILYPLAAARISREQGWSGWPGNVFLKKINESYAVLFVFPETSEIIDVYHIVFKSKS